MTIVKFDRMGQNHTPPVLAIDSRDPDTIAEAIYQEARRHLLSQGIDVDVDLEAMTATIYAGIRVAGTGSVTFA